MLPFYVINKIPPLKTELYSLYSRRADQFFPWLSKHLTKKDFVLDLGCGTGAVSRILKKKENINITLVDVQYNSMCDQFPIIIYDGQKLPFPDNHFTKCLLITVLHHCNRPDLVLNEAIRVTSGEIIVIEDVFSDIFSRIITFIGDCLVNWEIHSPFTNHTQEDWAVIFKRKKLNIVYTENFSLKCIGFPFELALFVLSKASCRAK